MVTPQTAQEAVDGTSSADTGLPAYFVIALIAIVVPISFEIGGLFLTASRAVLLCVTPVLLIRFFQGQYGALNKGDILFGLFLAWFALANLYHAPGRFVTFVGSNFVIIAGGYLLGRCCIRGPRAFRQMIILYGCLVLVSLPFAFYEMRTGEMPVARFLEKIPGISSSKDVEYPSRNDLERVQFVFVHPIHYGLFCAYIFALIAIGLRETMSFSLRWGWALLIGVCCFTSGSSGPFTGILIAVMLILYGALTGGRWKFLIWLSVISYVILEVLSNRPAYFVIIEKMAFNPGTAFGRRLILEAGIAQVTRTPIFGTPHALPLPFWMTGSLDNYWLLVAVAYGIPAFVFLMGAYFYVIIKACKADLTAAPHLAALRKGWVIGMIGSIFALATVAIWSELLSLTFLMFGSGVWLMGATAKPTQELEPQTAEPKRPSTRYTRFPVTQRANRQASS